MSKPSDPQQKCIVVEEIELSYWERGVRDPVRPSLLFVHATGFHARVWDRIVEPFADYHSIAIDQRGHGRSSKREISHWAELGRDLAAFVDALQLRDLIGVGHSVGGHAMVDAAAQAEAFSRLVLLDPTIVEPGAYGGPLPYTVDESGHPAARRRADFESVQAMIEQLRDKGNFALFDEQMFRDYCTYGLLPADCGMTLACPPRVEASVYMAARTNGGVYAGAERLQMPITVVRAQRPPGERQAMDFASSPTWPGLVTRFANARELHLPDCTHFIPMQKPDFVIELIRAEIDAWRA